MSSERQRNDMAIPQTVADGSDYDASGKSVQEIENDISETRAKLGGILHQIEREIAPQHLLQRAIGSLKNGMNGGMGRGMGGTFRDNPAALILMGVGLGWFALSASRSRRLGDDRGALPERISGGMGDASDQAASLAAPVPERSP